MNAARAHHPEIAQSLDDVADPLEFEEANPFRVRALGNVARVVRSLDREISDILSPGEDAPKLPEIGTDLADKIYTLASTGHLPLLDQLRKKTPAIAPVLLRPPNLGLKRVRGYLPDLVALSDLRGDLHVHGRATDGHNRLEELGEAATKRGYEYIASAKDRGCFIELNAHPDRLDLTDFHCRMAKEAGVLVSIATDAHRVEELSCLRFGVGQGRRGRLEKGHVLDRVLRPEFRAPAAERSP
jgi:DNA polymerase/3'-5' exonuclease PolX